MESPNSNFYFPPNSFHSNFDLKSKSITEKKSEENAFKYLHNPSSLIENPQSSPFSNKTITIISSNPDLNSWDGGDFHIAFDEEPDTFDIPDDFNHELEFPFWNGDTQIVQDAEIWKEANCLYEELYEIEEDLKKWESSFKKINSLDLLESWNFSGKVLLKILKFIQDSETNKNTLVEVTNFLFSTEHSEKIENAINMGSAGFKWVNPASQLTFYIIKAILISFARKALRQHKQEMGLLEKRLTNFEASRKYLNRSYFYNPELIAKIHTLNRNLRAHEQEMLNQKNLTKNKSFDKFKKLLGKFAVLFIQMLEMMKESASHICKNFIIMIEEIIEINQITKSHRLQKEWEYHLRGPKIHQGVLRNVFISEEDSREERNLKARINSKGNRSQVYHDRWAARRQHSNIRTQTEWERFFTEIKNAPTVDLVKKVFTRNKITLEVPQELDDWRELIAKPSFQRYLRLSFYQQKGNPAILLNQNEIGEFLEQKRKARHEELQIKAQKASEDIHQLLSYALNTYSNIDEMASFLKEQQIYLDELSTPINSKLELVEMLENFNNGRSREWEKLCFLLAAKRIEYHEIFAVHAEQVFRQALLSKINAENRFFNYQKIACGVSFIFSLVQIIFTAPFQQIPWTSNYSSQLGIAARILKTLVVDLSKSTMPGIALVLLLHPKLSLKLVSVFHHTLKLIFSRLYKPHEWSLKGNKYTLQILYFTVMSNLLQYISTFIEGMQWTKNKVVNVVKSYFTSRALEENPSTEGPKEINRKIESRLLHFKSRILDLETELNHLRAMDLTDILQFDCLYKSQNPPFNIHHSDERFEGSDDEEDNEIIIENINAIQSPFTKSKKGKEEIIIIEEIVEEKQTPANSQHLQNKENNPCGFLANVIVDFLQNTNIELFPESFIEFLTVNMDIDLSKYIPDDLKSSDDCKSVLKKHLEHVFYKEDTNFARFYQSSRFKNLASTGSSLLSPSYI